jgi:hypothetical protein
MCQIVCSRRFRQGKIEHGAFSGFRLNPNGTVVAFNHLLADREANAGA